MFGQPQVVVTLEREGLVVDTQRWAYPPGTIHNQEVIDAKQFLKAWSDYWQSLGLKRASVLLVISDQLLFSKVADHETAEFWQEVPIDQGNIARKVIYTPTKVTMMATNRELFTLVAQGIANANGEVRAVVPANYMQDSDSIKQANFLNESNRTVKNKSNNLWLWFLIGGVWIGVIILVWLRLSHKI